MGQEEGIGDEGAHVPTIPQHSKCLLPVGYGTCARIAMKS